MDLDQSVTIAQWDTLDDVYEKTVSGREKMSLKWFHRNNPELLEVLQPGTYIFSGAYDAWSFFAFLDAWPQVTYENITILEWWSIYDIDQALEKKWLTEAWAYQTFVTSAPLIKTYSAKYEFLSQAEKDLGDNLSTLEWFLYPETYFIDTDKDIIDQLVFLQLESIKQKVREPYAADIWWWLSPYLQDIWYSFPLSFYGAMRLASVIEKEERSQKNRPKIASVFFNRLADNMRIDADITLCYGLQKPYADCPPAVIVENLTDTKNLYNTRALAGLPPTPIANIHVSSLAALLDSQKTSNYFYLHDDTGEIHLSKDLSEHSRKKSKYLN